MENGLPAGAEAAGILEAGTRVGKYEIRRLIGLGSMSAVYEGARPETGTRVALKVLSPRRAALPAARARFLIEAKLTARVRHPHIVDVIEVGEDAERSYLAMEMLEGEDLARRLRRSSFLSGAETADILVPVCEAVAAAHGRGVVHRDLKPANIFLASRDGKIHPVVLDFGIANDNEDAAGTVADPGLVFGTPYYLSPEQVADHRAASQASDQWALGVILYECLTGARPYDGDTLDDVLTAIRAGHALPPGERRSGISPELGQVVMRAMSSDPKQRFGSVSDLADALRPFRSAPGEARPPRRRPPSSPSIMAEASTQSPFSRTLTPEPDVLDGLWFEPDPEEETTGEGTGLPANPAASGSSVAAAVADAERVPALGIGPAFAIRWAALGRGRIAAGVAGVLAGLALMLVITHGRSAHRAGSPQPATALIAGEPDTAASSAASAVKQPTAMPAPRAAAAEPTMAPEPAVVKEPAATNEPTASKEPAATKEPAAIKEPAVSKGPAVTKALAAVKPPVLVKEPTAGNPPTAEREPTVTKAPAAVKERPVLVMEPVAKAPAIPTPTRSPKPEHRERAAAVSNVAPAPTGSVARESAEKPRARTSPEVRLHNGVPLLD